VVAISAGGDHSLALSGLPPSVVAPAWSGPRFLVATAHRPFHQRIIAKNSATAYGAAGLPPGLVLDSNTGLITGQPAQAGTYAVVISATNSVGSSAWTVTMFVNEPAAPAIANGLVLAGLGCGFSHPVVVYNAPQWYGASGLPPGLVMDAQTGLISGVPVDLGDFVVSLVASNQYGLRTGNLTLRVSPLVMWGYNWDVQPDVPGGLSNVVAIAKGGSHSLALTAEGWVAAWGDNYFGQTNVPDGLSNAVAIAAGGAHSLALTSEGRVVAWGDNGSGQTNVSSGLSNVVAIAAGGYHNLALTTEGHVVGWGYNSEGRMDVPDGLSNVVAIAAGGSHNLALTSEGRVVAWGDNGSGQTNVPSGLGNAVAISAGGYQSLALTSEGRVVTWGDDGTGQTNVSSGLSNVVAIAAGYNHSLALTSEGRVVAWGWNSFGQTDVPSGLSNVVAIAAGGSQNLALLRQPTVPTPRLELSRGMSGLELQAHGVPGISCELLRASRLPGPWLPGEPVTFTNSIQLLRAPDASQPAQFFRLLRK
jgi:hypothetical protein